MKDILARAARIRLLIFDVDGVLTDGSLYLSDDGQEYKAFHSRDGHGIKMLQANGVQAAVITGRSSQVVIHRMDNLGIKHVYQGQEDKRVALDDLLTRLSVSGEEAAYVGDDVVDLPAMRRVGLAIAVQDAHPAVKRHAHWQTPSRGGRGAARDVCELLLEAQGKLDGELEKYL
ncbi:MAG TPA: 3-deoxy-manno-octulosonate-8-phosphatase KdsC [Gammaproteobacteria bacterium]|nr:3-deoxy-manno-octulosonate-8-phosphatase KdsC [Gammaproteobacteria bacterium]